LNKKVASSNLKPTTRKCMHLVTRGHFRSRDKDGSHTIRYAEKPRCAQTSRLCLIERELLRIEVLHCTRIGIFNIFCSCDLDLDPMTFIYELDPYTACANMNFLRQGFRKLSDRHTDINTTKTLTRAASWVVTKRLKNLSQYKLLKTGDTGGKRSVSF